MISELSYVGLRSPNHAEWERFGAEILGAEVAPAGTDDAVPLRVDEVSFRLTVLPSERDELAHPGCSERFLTSPPGIVDSVDSVLVGVGS